MKQVGPGVVEAAAVVVGEVLAAELNHFRVQVDHRNPFHRLMGQRLAECAALAAAADEDLLRSGVAEHRRVHQRFVVDMLVPFRGLGLAVQDQAAAE